MRPDDFSKGDFITIVRGLSLHQNWDKGDCATITGYDRSYLGDVMQIIAIDYPFIVLKQMSGFIISKEPKHFDIREYQFKKCSKEYLEALGVKP